jgi:hypothetical protein
MISNNGEQISNEIDQYAVELKRKLEGMVAGFAGDVAYQAAISTPKATSEYVATHQSLYEARFNEHSIPKEPGFHAGSWQYGENGLSVKLQSEINTTPEVEYQAQQQAKARYNLGDTFVIGSESPNMPYLNQRDGIEDAVTDSAARAAYSSNLAMHFKRG